MPELERVLMGQLAMNYDSARNLVADAKVHLRKKKEDFSDEKKVHKEARRLYELKMQEILSESTEEVNKSTTAGMTVDDMATPIKSSGDQALQQPPEIVTPSPDKPPKTNTNALAIDSPSLNLHDGPMEAPVIDAAVGVAAAAAVAFVAKDKVEQGDVETEENVPPPPMSLLDPPESKHDAEGAFVESSSDTTDAEQPLPSIPSEEVSITECTGNATREDRRRSPKTKKKGSLLRILQKSLSRKKVTTNKATK